MIKKITDYKKKAKFVIESCVEKKNYLESGDYFLDSELRYFYRNDSQTIDFIERVIKNNNYDLIPKEGLKNIVKRALVPKKIYLTNDSRKDDFKGSIYLLSNDKSYEKDVKIFDINSNRVLTVYFELDNLKKKITDSKKFGSNFNIPEIMGYDFENKTSVEELILTKPKNTWNKSDYIKIIDSIFNSYKKYYQSYSKENKYSHGSLLEMVKDLKNDVVLKELVLKIEKNISNDLIINEIPIVNQHGDLWLYNTMLGENGKIYFIDWEHSGGYFLFYDLFWWMQNEAIYNDNFLYLEKYIMGGYDDQFKCVFNALNYNFEKRRRKDYLYIFILELLYKRIINDSEDIKKTASNLYTDLFIKIKKHRHKDNF